MSSAFVLVAALAIVAVAGVLKGSIGFGAWLLAAVAASGTLLLVRGLGWL